MSISNARFALSEDFEGGMSELLQDATEQKVEPGIFLNENGSKSLSILQDGIDHQIILSIPSNLAPLNFQLAKKRLGDEESLNRCQSIQG